MNFVQIGIRREEEVAEEPEEGDKGGDSRLTYFTK